MPIPQMRLSCTFCVRIPPILCLLIYKSLGYLSHTFEPSEARNSRIMTPKNIELDSIFKSCGRLFKGSANENISPRGIFSHWFPRLPIPCVWCVAWIQKGGVNF